MPDSFDWDSQAVQDLITNALAEDLGSGDATSLAVVPENSVAKARIVAKSHLVVAGLPIVERVFHKLDPDVKVSFLASDGDHIDSVRDVVLIEGRVRAILAGERTALNFLARLSGIATLTNLFVFQLAGTRAKIRDTRKTTPGFRTLEKYAVKMGGGTNHRIGLFDAILLKENHIAMAGGVTAALAKAHVFACHRAHPPEMTSYESFAPPKFPAAITVQIEVRDQIELREALEAGAQSVLLDNMSPADAAACVKIVRENRPACIVEISGGINLANARAYAESGADFLSSGALTHSAPAADFSLLMAL